MSYVVFKQKPFGGIRNPIKTASASAASLFMKY